MPLFVREGRTAWLEAAAAEESAWATVIERRSGEGMAPVLKPKFQIGRDDRIFCMGSCFARNIEEHLLYRDLTVLSKRFVCILDRGNRPNGLVNKFTPDSMLQEVTWLDTPPADPARHFLETPRGWLDLHLTPGVKAAPLDQVMRQRAYLNEDYFSRLRDADVMVVTLGLNEVWVDRSTGDRLNAPPPLKAARRELDRFTLEVTTAGENAERLNQMWIRLKAINPALRMVLTVSPVPLARTFSGRDAMMANTLSKTVLRAAAAEFAEAHADVDYFPSYEMVTLTPFEAAFADDGRHVQDGMVGRVVEVFLKTYLSNAPERLAPAGFTELGYLEAHPDVDRLVRDGVYESGFQHWREIGAEAGFAIAPETPSPALARVGAV